MVRLNGYQVMLRTVPRTAFETRRVEGGVWRLKTLLAVLAVGVALGLAGCQDPLFPADQPRSQYERYETLRGRETPQKQINAVGREEPAMRERLTPLGEKY